MTSTFTSTHPAYIMTDSPRYSIIVPVYNRSDEVADLLRSLASQTDKGFRDHHCGGWIAAPHAARWSKSLVRLPMQDIFSAPTKDVRMPAMPESNRRVDAISCF